MVNEQYYHLLANETIYEDAKRFYYNFGPNRLDELLREEMDE